VFIRRIRTLAGFLIGVLVLVGLSTLLAGPGVWPGFFTTLEHLAHFRPFLQFPDHVDLYSFSVMAGRFGLFARVLLLCVAAAGGTYLVRAWWRARISAASGPATLIWSATITWTLLLNVYVPVQDSIFAVPSFIATARSLGRFRPATGLYLSLALLLVSPITVGVATNTGCQLLTGVLLALAILQTALRDQFIRRGNDG